MHALLSLAGRHGPAVLFVGVFLGLVLPPLADAARPLMGVAVFVFTLGAFLKVDRAALRSLVKPPGHPGHLVAVLVWTAVGVPLAAWALIGMLPLPDGMRTGMLLCMLAPPVGSAAAMAAMLGLNPALALACTLCVSLLTPLLLPPAALALGSIELHLDAAGLTLRLALLVGGAAACAALLRRYAASVTGPGTHAMTGVSVVGLLVVAVGAMQGMQSQLLLHAHDVLWALVAAFALNAGFWMLGATLFAALGRGDALTVGLVSGNRNVTLVWVAAAPWLADAPQVQLYLAASVFPIFMLPLPVARLLHAWDGLRQRRAALPVPSGQVAAAPRSEP